ncbi:hypothetical protein J1N35_034124 [Gossypium stocksii]|uniref:Uncharacterized protein n=1 Tax=Gossypium stocksii TaxID=47602 RepID=A0A9D3UTC4_9ROSI|nr:hypothetical protein J1N35_034124 [Gossypium stocksii]
MGKGDTSGKGMANVTIGYELGTTSPKFKRRKVSVVQDFLPGCGREATTNLELKWQITVDQGNRYKAKGVYIHRTHDKSAKVEILKSQKCQKAKKPKG